MFSYSIILWEIAAREPPYRSRFNGLIGRYKWIAGFVGSAQ